MRLRLAKVAIVPVWVLKHPEVYGNATRMAIYTGLQVTGYESPGIEWRSLRELAISVSEVVGISSEACRKHLASMEAVGILRRTAEGDLLLPQDDPELGHRVGLAGPESGSGGPNFANHTSLLEREKEEHARLGTENTSSSEHAERDERFKRFWEAYPRKVAKQAAIKAWNAAWKRGDVDAIRDGFKAWTPVWARREKGHIPHASTFLNEKRYLERPDTEGRKPTRIITPLDYTVTSMDAPSYDADDEGLWEV